MATYILFWNPDISSYTMERFQDDFRDYECVGNWSFYEHEDVREDDYFYMVRCGKGRTGIVMRGIILSDCYEDEDWSPKGRRPIFYADIRDAETINPETAEVMLTPEKLTELLPDFNWFGGHSGRRLSDEYAAKLDGIWLDYINSNAEMFEKRHAHTYDYDRPYLTPVMERLLSKSHGNKCEICGYDYEKVFGKELIDKLEISNPYYYIFDKRLPRILYRICHNCQRTGYENVKNKITSKE